MSLEEVCRELEIAPNLELLVTSGMSLEGVCHDLIHYFTTNSSNQERASCDQENTLKKAPSKLVQECSEFGVRLVPQVS
jgi:hypothetical protein